MLRSRPQVDHKVGARFHNPLDRIRKFQEVGNFDFTYSPCSSLKAGKEDLDLATAVGEEGTGVRTDGALVCPTVVLVGFRMMISSLSSSS